MEFEEGDALTAENVSVEGTTTSEGWHVRTKLGPCQSKILHMYRMYVLTL